MVLPEPQLYSQTPARQEACAALSGREGAGAALTEAWVSLQDILAVVFYTESLLGRVPLAALTQFTIFSQ